MSTAIDLPEIRPLLATADHVDVKTAESPVTLAEFVTGAVGRPPGPAIRFLMGVRGVLARLMRLHAPDGLLTDELQPEDIAFAPGGKVGFFTVFDGAEDRFILLGDVDTHLTGYLAIAVEPGTGGRNRFSVATIVEYRRWTGPLYFTIVRPFHHVVISSMVRKGARGLRP